MALVVIDLATDRSRRWHRIATVGLALWLGSLMPFVAPGRASACVHDDSPRLAQASRSVFLGTVVGKRPGRGRGAEYAVKVTQHVFGERLRSVTVFGPNCGWQFIVGDRAVFALGDLREPTVSNSAAYRYLPDGRIQDGHLQDVPDVATVTELLALLRTRLPDTAVSTESVAASGTDSSSLPLLVAAAAAGAILIRRRRSQVERQTVIRSPSHARSHDTKESEPSP